MNGDLVSINLLCFNFGSKGYEPRQRGVVSTANSRKLLLVRCLQGV